MSRKVEAIDYINTAYKKPRMTKLKQQEQLGNAYLNKLYKQLLMAAREIFGSYTIYVSSISMLSYLLEMEFNAYFTRSLDRLEQLGKIEKHLTKDGWWIEVIPF